MLSKDPASLSATVKVSFILTSQGNCSPCTLQQPGPVFPGVQHTHVLRSCFGSELNCKLVSALPRLRR
jgi:hypothetical protein